VTFLAWTVLAASCGPALAADRDRFGGWTGRRFKATGFFRTEHDGKRWWLVTPEGNAFVSLGINHYHPNWWAQRYNRDHWLKVFGGRRAMDATWQNGFRKAAKADMARLGINTLGVHTYRRMLADPPAGAFVPYVRDYVPIAFSHYLKPKPDVYVDIFAPAFEKHCAGVASRVAAPYASDPMLLGYCMADCPILTDHDAKVMGGTTWPRALRNLGANAPGKQAYVAAMRRRYKAIVDFNRTYAANFETWDQLAAAKDWRKPDAPANRAERDDNHAFMLLCVDRYYSAAKAALRKADPNHLFFGDKINANTDCLDRIVEVTSRYTDVVCYQYYARWPGQKALLERLGPKVRVPLLNGDTGYSVVTQMMPNPYGPHSRDQRERAKWLVESCEGALAHPSFVGWHMCGIIDTWKTMRGKERAQHQGLMTVRGEYYPEMEKAVQGISQRMYRIAAGVAPGATGHTKAVNPSPPGHRRTVTRNQISGSHPENVGSLGG
jgi:hypothetical protein